jgi:hypothetical protein
MTAHPVVGTWRLAVTPAAAAPHPALFAFAADGTLAVVGPPALPAPPGAPYRATHLASGLGVWAAAGASAAAFTADLLASDEDGTFVGTLTLRGTAAVGGDRREIAGDYEATAVDPGGQVVAGAGGGGRLRGTRMAVEPPGTPAPERAQEEQAWSLGGFGGSG